MPKRKDLKPGTVFTYSMYTSAWAYSKYTSAWAFRVDNVELPGQPERGYIMELEPGMDMEVTVIWEPPTGQAPAAPKYVAARIKDVSWTCPEVAGFVTEFGANTAAALCNRAEKRPYGWSHPKEILKNNGKDCWVVVEARYVIRPSESDPAPALPPTPVLYAGLTAEQCFERFQYSMRHDEPVQILPVQRAKAQEMWSAALRAKTEASKEKARTQVVVDLYDGDE